MTQRTLLLPLTLALALLPLLPAISPNAQAQMASAPAAKPDGPPGLLTHEQAEAILPATVFYRGQSATIQGRNSAGIRLTGGRLVLTAIVDTGGYSTAVQQSYQACLFTEVPLKVGDKTLPAGAYGYGFVTGDRMVVMDIGAHQILSVPTTRDAEYPRPRPLQILADPSHPGAYRLMLGRSYVELTPATP